MAIFYDGTGQSAGQQLLNTLALSCPSGQAIFALAFRYHCSNIFDEVSSQGPIIAEFQRNQRRLDQQTSECGAAISPS
jgi:hypothetical protein